MAQTILSRADSARWMAEGQRAWLDKEYTQALRAFEVLRETYPDNENLLFNHAILLKEKGDLHEAETLLRRIYARNPQFPLIRIHLALILMARESYGEAAALLNAEPPAGSSERPDYFRVRAYLAFWQRDTAAALVFLNKALAEWPENPETYLDLAQYYLIKGDTLLARRNREAAELFGASPARMAMIKALEWEKKGAYDLAIGLLQGTPRLSPTLMRSWQGLRVRLLAQKGSWTQAREVLQQMFQKDTPPASWLSLSSALRFMEGDWPGALADAAKALEIDPERGEAWLNKGVIYAHLNQMEEACMCWRKARELNTQVAEVYLQFQCP
jgi:tetratricopeptide (TPR) repeat protein